MPVLLLTDTVLAGAEGLRVGVTVTAREVRVCRCMSSHYQCPLDCNDNSLTGVRCMMFHDTRKIHYNHVTFQ